jgi:hypothetical protein
VADTKISALTAVATPAATDEFAVNQGGVSKRMTLAQIDNYVGDPRNFSTASQSVSANTITYLTGSGIVIPGAAMVAGQMYRWYIGVAKTAAGTAAPSWQVKVGTNQSTADTTVQTLAGTAQVATASGTCIIVTVHVLTVSATGTIATAINTGTASFGIGGAATSSAFANNANGGSRIGLTVNTGASAVWTVHYVMGEMT